MPVRSTSTLDARGLPLRPSGRATRPVAAPILYRAERTDPTPKGDSMGADAASTAGKADFTHIYDQPDPRDYFRTLGRLNYEIPHHAQPVFRRVLDALRADRPAGAAPPRVLDLCCSYGVNAALLRCRLRLADLFDRYTDPAVDALDPQALCAADRDWFGGRLLDAPVPVVGLDAAEHAVAYACRTGVLEDGWSEDLEQSEPSQRLRRTLDGIDLVTCTGGIGYITQNTLSRVARPRDGRPAPWVAAFVLRQVPYDAIVQALGEHGLVTEQAAALTVPQRRFADDGEQQAAVRAVRERGLDTRGLEDTGRYFACFYLSRPTADASRLPLADLVAGLGG